jgi:hypothetical protein
MGKKVHDTLLDFAALRITLDILANKIKESNGEKK